MKIYIGIKQIEAKPLNLGDYNKYRGWDIPDDEDPLKQGYLIKYPDGYESWSPADVFGVAYYELDDSNIPKSSVMHMMNYANDMLCLLPPSRVKSIVSTKIEELLLWVEHKL